MYFNVKDYGAVGDGVALDTAAIQKAIDACSENGGGKVLIPSGNYLTGKLLLKDFVTVEIGDGALLLASPDPEDYPASEGYVGSLFNRLKREKKVFKDERVNRTAIFYACEAKNIAITGNGTVDGRFKEFLVKNKHERLKQRWQNDMFYDGDVYSVGRKPRPILVFLEACEGVNLEGVSYINAPHYTIQCRSCRDIQIHNVRIRNYIGADNSDGLHFSSCADVRISDCDLECGDDTIAIDSNDCAPSERFTIQNCVFLSRNNCFRIFTGLAADPEKRRMEKNGRVSDIVIDNCIVKDASSFAYFNVDQGLVERVAVTNICGQLKRIGTAFLLTAHSGKINQVTLSDWNVVSRGVGYIYADEEDAITNLIFDNINIKVCPRTKLYGNGLIITTVPGREGQPFYWLSHYAPYFFQIIRAQDISINRFTIDWGEADIDDIGELSGPAHLETIPAQWPKPLKSEARWPAIRAEHVKNMDVTGLVCRQFGDHSSAVELFDVKNTRFYAYRLLDGACDRFLYEEQCENIVK